MSFEHLDRIVFTQDTTIRDILARFNETAGLTDRKGFGIVIDADGIAAGVVTDGDIRRKISKGMGLDEPVLKAMKQDFTYTKQGDSWHSVLRQFDSLITILPVLSDQGEPVDLYLYSQFVASSRAEPRIIRARVPVRISFSGGGTDISQYINHTSTTVLSATIDKFCTASVLVRNDQEIHITSKDLDLSYSAKNLSQIEYGDQLDLIKATVKVMRPDFGFDLETFAEFEPGTGLGGSSAVAVSVIGALNQFRNETRLNIYHIADLAYQVERIDLGIAGGWQDQYATAFGGFNWIEFRQDEVVVSPLRIPRETVMELEYNLMLFRVGGLRNSGKLHGLHLDKIKQNDDTDGLTRHFSEMTDLARSMKEALLKGKVKRFGDLLHLSWELKKKINGGVSNELIDEYYENARNLGALGGKLLGAGESGYLLVYASPLYQKKIRQALEAKDARFESIKFNQNGLEVWTAQG